jgi:adenylylsulfate kinase
MNKIHSKDLFKPCVIWLTGLSGAGKSTISINLQTKLNQLGITNYLLDGDSLRKGLCKDLGFSEEDRYESCRRMAEVAKLFVTEGYIVICASISPYKKMRQSIRKKFLDDQFIEVFVDTPLVICEARDPKGLYKKARAGNIAMFTGIDSSYEAPENPEIHLRTDQQSIDVCVQTIVDYLNTKHPLPSPLPSREREQI